MLLRPPGLANDGQLNNAHLLRLRLSGQRNAYRAVAADGDVGGRRRNRDGRLQLIAVCRYQDCPAHRAGTSRRACSRSGRWAAESGRTRSLNREVERIAGVAQVALGLHDLGIAGARAEADLQAGSDGRLLGGRGAGHDVVLIEKVGELHAARLKSRRARVRQIVRDVIEVDLLRGHAAGCCVKSMKHPWFSF